MMCSARSDNRFPGVRADGTPVSTYCYAVRPQITTASGADWNVLLDRLEIEILAVLLRLVLIGASSLPGKHVLTFELWI
jgi:hypothetical protein